MEYLDVAAARARSGLRLVLTAGVPGPWGEAAKGVLYLKSVDYAPVAQLAGETNDALVEWTGVRNAPQAVYGDEPARTGWLEVLLLAERLGPDTPSLIPEDPIERATMMGIASEICGEGGLGWSRRLAIFHPTFEAGQAPESMQRMAAQYGYSKASAEHAMKRIAAVLELIARTLHAQREAGKRYLVGDRISAADVYWATFSAMVEPMEAERCPMPEYMRGAYVWPEPYDPILIEHRDFIYGEHLPVPLDF